MIPDDIIDILQKYQDDVAEEISVINLSIERISDALNTVNNILTNTLHKSVMDVNETNIKREYELLHDSQVLRDYTRIINPVLFKNVEIQNTREQILHVICKAVCPTCERKLIEFPLQQTICDNSNIDSKSIKCYKCPQCNNEIFILENDAEDIDTSNIQLDFKYYNKISFEDVIVIFNINKCSKHNHKIEDLSCELPLISPSGEIISQLIPIIHCKTCRRYIMLKSDYDKLKGVPLCQINDESHSCSKNSFSENDFIYSNSGGSKLKQYGYNVNCHDKLTTEQRRQILLIQLLSKNITKSEIYSILDTNINNGLNRVGSKKDWTNAVNKWKADRQYIESLDLKSSDIDIKKITLKFSINSR
jgi:hypothetical protein